MLLNPKWNTPKDKTLTKVVTRWTVTLAITAALVLPLVMCGPDDHSITDCSSRNKPTHYDKQTGKNHC